MVFCALSARRRGRGASRAGDFSARDGPPPESRDSSAPAILQSSREFGPSAGRTRGYARAQVCKTLLPFKWRDTQEHEALLQEALGHSFNSVENFRPVILVDTANIHGEQLQSAAQVVGLQLDDSSSDD